MCFGRRQVSFVREAADMQALGLSPARDKDRDEAEQAGCGG